MSCTLLPPKVIVMSIFLSNHRATKTRFFSGSLYVSALLCQFLLFSSQPVSAEPNSGVDSEEHKLNALNLLYQQVLDTYISSGEKNSLPANMVDYASLRLDPRLAELKTMLQSYPRENLDSREKQIAFYLNAYNILAIAKVCQHWPLKKLKSLGTFYKPVWTHPVGEVCGEKMTLRKLEHEVLRSYGEPRIHFALNCASMSCPDLRHEPYVAERLEEQLAEQTALFMSQSGKGVLVEGGSLYLSSIFEWFAEDFESSGGVLAFIEPYLPTEKVDPSTAWVISGYLEYDWSVNDHLTGSELTKIKRSGNSTWFN